MLWKLSCMNALILSGLLKNVIVTFAEEQPSLLQAEDAG